MSFTTMNMFVRHILGFKLSSADWTAARRSGWSWGDILWESTMVSALEAHQDNQPARSRRLFQRANIIAKLWFSPTDIRHATVLVNFAKLKARQRLHKTNKFQMQALNIWQHATEQIKLMQIAPRTRSSLFHLRMEALHRDTFHDNFRRRFVNFAREFQETCTHIGEVNGPKHRHFSRWKGEKPTVFDDTRKILAACLLVIDQDK